MSNLAENINTIRIRRTPETTDLYKILQDQWESFRAHRISEGRKIPFHIEHEIDAYLKCGIVSCGFMRLKCSECPSEKVVAFSCKKKGFCVSCWAKRSAESAIHLVENVLPMAPYRQIVVSFPHPLRYWMNQDRVIYHAIHRIVIDLLKEFYEKKLLKKE